MHQTTTDTEPTTTRNMIDRRRAVTAAICLALTAVLTGLALWIPAIDLPLARSVGFANVTTAAAAVTGLFTLIQFSTGGAVEGLVARLLAVIRAGHEEIREALRLNRDAVADNTAAVKANTEALLAVDTSLRWLASQFDHGVGELRSAAADTTDTIAIVSQTVARVGNALAETQKVIAEGMTGLRKDIASQGRGRRGGQGPRRNGSTPRQPRGDSGEADLPIDEKFKAYLAGRRDMEQENGPPVA